MAHNNIYLCLLGYNMYLDMTKHMQKHFQSEMQNIVALVP